MSDSSPSAVPADLTEQPIRLLLLDTEVAQRLEKTVSRLSSASTQLNFASDDLAKAVNSWDVILKKLNLGIEVWVDTTSSGDSGDKWWDRGIGYAEVGDRWCLALRERSGDPVELDEQVWAFNQAPRWLRVEGISKLLELLEALVKRTEETTKKLHDEASRVLTMAHLAQAKKQKK